MSPMRQSLQLKFNPQLTMTPQLQQAIRLLQLSTLDLQKEITEQLYSNPLLEVDENGSIDANNGHQDSQPSTENSGVDLNLNSDDPLIVDRAQNASEPTATEIDEISGIQVAENNTMQTKWDDIARTPSQINSSGKEINLEDVYQVTESLRDHLHWQLNLTPFSARDKEIAEALIDAISDSGLISKDLHGITSHLNHQEQQDCIESDELVAVLRRLQQFDPPGIFARDFQECLLIQLNQLNSDTPYLAEAKALVKNFLDDIAAIEVTKLAKKSSLEQQQIQEALKLIRSLNPRPGEQLGLNNTEYIVPDVYIEKKSGIWRARLNDSNMPRLKINNTYANLIKRSDSGAENQYLKNNLAEARWFLRSLESRNDSLMRVAMAIVDFQQDFLDHGPVAMKPMVLSDIADQLDLHESTISRVTTRKYIDTPRGIFELKYFFSSHVGTAAAGECSSIAVCAILKEMVAAEKPSKPLSDNKLAALLAEQGIQVARRTVAKYRERINIPSSSNRKRLGNGA